MRGYLLWASLFLAVAASSAAEDFQALFGAKEKSISAEDKSSIYRQLGLTLDKGGSRFIAESCDDPAPYAVEVIDLNRDGTPEVFVVGGDLCTSGNTGSSIWLFIKSTSGYQLNLGFPAGKWTPLPERSKGFPDLKFASAGHCEEVWRWNGVKYAHSRDVAMAEGGCNAKR